MHVAQQKGSDPITTFYSRGLTTQSTNSLYEAMKQADVIFFLWSVGLVALQPVFFHTTTQSTNSVYEAMKQADVIFFLWSVGLVALQPVFFHTTPWNKKL